MNNQDLSGANSDYLNQMESAQNDAGHQLSEPTSSPCLSEEQVRQLSSDLLDNASAANSNLGVNNDEQTTFPYE